MKQFEVLLDTVTYNILINIFTEKGLIDDSIKLFNEMKQNNIPIDTTQSHTLHS
jgi:pentatricopeptide repeat protein